MAGYIKSKVSIESIRTNSKVQDPDVLVSPDVENVWGGWLVNP